jgi:hypothetical protein
VLKILAVSSVDQLAGGAEDGPNPGRLGMTTSNETDFPVDVFPFLVRSPIRGINSKNDPGQPWNSIKGIASGLLDFWCIK